MKASNVIAIRVLPPPTVQQRARRAAAAELHADAEEKRAREHRYADRRHGSAQRLPEDRALADSSGKNTAQVSASISICARSPSPRPAVMARRQADVNPNAA